MGEPTTRFGRWVATRDLPPLTGRRRAAVVGVLVALSLGVTAWAFHSDTSESAHERGLLSTGSRSTALVEDIYRDRRGSAFVQVTILIVDGDAEGWKVRVSLAPSTTVEEGDRVEVAYDPDAPGDLVVVGQASSPNDGLDMGAWILTALVAVRFAWSAWRSRSRTPASE